jgi:polysaccharide export outer membrane protein
MSWARRYGLIGFICSVIMASLFPLKAFSFEYVIGTDDVLRVSFWQQSDLNTVTRVRQDGSISLPVLGEIDAAGLTISQLERSIVAGISIYNKEISQARVEVMEYNSQKVYVTGEVFRPGKYTFEFIPNLWEVLREAGGPRERALLTEVTIIRADQEGGEKFIVNISQALEAGDLTQLPELKPGDTIIVPRLPAESAGTQVDILGRSTVFVYGQIARPGVYPIEEGTTLLHVVTQAGGPTEMADLKNVRVLVRQQDNRTSVATVNMAKHMKKGDPPDFLLHPGDTVVIPRRSGLWSGVWGGMTQVFAVTSGILGIFYIVDRVRD